MSKDLKQRRKGLSKQDEDSKAPLRLEAETTEQEQCIGAPCKRKDSSRVCPEPTTVLCLLSLFVCLVLTWFVFQQSVTFVDVEKTYRLLEIKASVLNALEEKVRLISEKCVPAENIMEQLKNLQMTEHIEYLQEDIINIRKWSKLITDKQEQLQQNMTALFQTITKREQNTNSITHEMSGKITIVKTDIRRISGLGSEVNTLTDSVQELEGKLEKVVRKTEQNIGHLLANNIERITQLKGSVTRNSERIDMIKNRFSELMADFRKQSDMLLNLQSDGVKVLKTLTFVNDLKPKVYNMKNDLALIKPVTHDLTLRIGRLASDLLQREAEIAFLNEKVSYLTQVRTEVRDMKDKLTDLSESS